CCSLWHLWFIFIFIVQNLIHNQFLMPIFDEIHVGDGKIVIWEIDEVLEFFESRTGLKAPQSNPKKQLEHLCGRYLLTVADPKINLESLDVDQHDKPYCKEYNGHFSISH